MLAQWIDALADRIFPGDLGARGERAAARYLRRRGYVIVGRRLRTRLGEIDLIAIHGRTVVFVEVKTRRAADADPTESVDADKQRRLSRLAVAYLKRHGLLEHAARIDVVAVTWPAQRGVPQIMHVQDAFPVQLGQSMFG